MAYYDINNDLDHNNDYYVPADSPEALRRYSSSVDRRATIDLDEKEESLNLRTTRKRFLVLGLYMLCASFQTYTTNCLNPMSLANSPSEVIQSNFANVKVSILSLIFFLSCLLLSHPFSILAGRMDLKRYLIWSSFLTALSLIMRCIFISCTVDYNNKVVLYVTQIPLSIAACMSLICPPQISIQWFPQSERRSATGLALLSMYLGVSYSFIIDCILIVCYQDAPNLIKKFRYFQMYQAIFGVFIYLLMLFALPKVDITFIPSFLSLSQRFSIKSSLSKLKEKGRIWICLTCSAIIIGSFLFFFYQISWVVDQLDLFDTDTGQVLDTSSLLYFALSVLGTLILAILATYGLFRLSDRFHRLFPFLIGVLIMYTSIFIILTIFVFTFLDYWKQVGQLVFFLITGNAASTCIFVFTPLFAEFMCDFMYPIPEEFTYAIFFSSIFVMPTAFSFAFLHAGEKDDSSFAKAAICVVMGCAALGTILFTTLKDTKNKRRVVASNAQRRDYLNNTDNVLSNSFNQTQYNLST